MDWQTILDIIMAVLAPTGVLGGLIIALINKYKSKAKLQQAKGKVDLLKEQLKDEDVSTNPKDMKRHIIQVLDEISTELAEEKK